MLTQGHKACAQPAPASRLSSTYPKIYIWLRDVTFPSLITAYWQYRTTLQVYTITLKLQYSYPVQQMSPRHSQIHDHYMLTYTRVVSSSPASLISHPNAVPPLAYRHWSQAPQRASALEFARVQNLHSHNAPPVSRGSLAMFADR